MGALAADAARAGPGSDVGCAAGADRPARRVSGDAHRGTSSRPSAGAGRPGAGACRRWRRELAMIRQTVAGVDEPQVVAGDFNATRDHGPFRELLAAGFVDCADASQNRSWPGFT